MMPVFTAQSDIWQMCTCTCITFAIEVLLLAYNSTYCLHGHSVLWLWRCWTLILLCHSVLQCIQSLSVSADVRKHVARQPKEHLLLQFALICWLFQIKRSSEGLAAGPCLNEALVVLIPGDCRLGRHGHLAFWPWSIDLDCWPVLLLRYKSVTQISLSGNLMSLSQPVLWYCFSREKSLLLLPAAVDYGVIHVDVTYVLMFAAPGSLFT